MTPANRRIYAWALYDWANSAFATAVIAGFFPIFFKQYWSAGADVTESTFQLGAANAAAGAVILVLAPILGAVADQGGYKKRFLAFFTVLGVTATAALWWVGRGEWWTAALVYAVAAMAFQGANAVYDALIVDVAPPERRDRVSALGYALGYLGGGILFALCVAMTLMPWAFGLPDRETAVRVSFPLVALWWLGFSIPLFLTVRESRPDAPPRAPWRAGLRQLRDTLREIRRLRGVGLFLIAYWLYIDGVDTIVRMAVDYGLSIGFDATDLIAALLLTQFIGFPAALVFGRLGERIGAKRGIFVGIGVYVLVTLWGASMEERWEFYAIACVIGLVQGGVQALSRSLYSRIIPPHQAAEFFGFYNVLGKFAVILGPLLMGAVGWLTGSPRAGILVLLVLFFAGAAVLAFVDEDKARAGWQAQGGNS